MKKALIVLAVFLVLAVAAVYLFLPEPMHVSRAVRVSLHPERVQKVLNEGNWQKWWPAKQPPVAQAGEGKAFFYNHTRFIPEQPTFNGYTIRLGQQDEAVASVLQVLPVPGNKALLTWSYTAPGGTGPLKKIGRYMQGRRTAHDMGVVLDSLKAFLEQDENVYGLQIAHEIVKDTALVAVRFTTDQFPATKAIYDHIEQLRRYIAAQGATETNAPMLHIRPLEQNRFETMVAIPTSKILPGNGSIQFKRMIPGKILAAEVRGGQATVEKTLQQLELYAKDNRLTAPAIPFASLLTDRTKEGDTSKWLTRIYYPVL